MVKFLLLTLTLFSLLACSSHRAVVQKELTASEYDLLITQRKNALAPGEFKAWLEEERRKFQAQKEGIVGALESTSDRGSYQETMTSPIGSGGTGNFNVQMTNLELKRLEERQRLIESKIRTIDALLSSISRQ